MDQGRSPRARLGTLPRRVLRALLLLALLVAACWLCVSHLEAWNTGPRRPLLSYDAAQYALAARGLANDGRLATTYALPIELAAHPRPPWPLAVVQPGLVLAEAAIFAMVPDSVYVPGQGRVSLATPHEREWLALVLPFTCFIVLVLGIALGATRLAHRYGGGNEAGAMLVGITAAAGLMLDPEAQHFATGGFTELPFALGLFVAVWLLSAGGAARRPLAFGLLLGATGLFRANMLILVPLFAVATALSVEATSPGRRLRIALFVLAGYALPLAPWWFYKWQAFGSPSWDLTRFVLWDGVGGRSWFSLYHLPEVPDVPHGLEAARLVTAKIASNLPGMLLATLTGPRGLWLGALVLWLVVVRDPHMRALRAAGWLVLLAMGIGVLAACASIPWIRYVFPVRILVELGGILALFDLIRRAPATFASPAIRKAMGFAVVAVVITWGSFQHVHGLAEAEAAADERAIPSSLAMELVVQLIDAELGPDEPIMSNLGPTLAWYAKRPVVHLALGPEDVDECRRRYEFRHVLLAFRSAERAWRGWDQIVRRPAEAPDRPEWNIRRVRQYQSPDAFILIWIEMNALEPGLAGPGSMNSAGLEDVRLVAQ